MLGNKKSGAPAASGSSTSNDKPVDTIDTLVGPKGLFKGDLEFGGGLRVDGQVQGKILAKDDGNSTVVVSESGQVEGDISVPHVIINGTVNGNIKSVAKVELQEKARINGDVHYKAVEMALGASINGNLVCEAAGEEAGGSAGSAAGPGEAGENRREAPQPATAARTG